MSMKVLWVLKEFTVQWERLADAQTIAQSRKVNQPAQGCASLRSVLCVLDPL